MAQVNHFAINLNSPTIDSRASTMSTVQDLNSASSLSWADDEVENLATFKVQHFLDSLDNFLYSRILPESSCFDISEAEQWAEMITNLKLMDRLKETRKVNNIIPKEFQHNSTKKKLEITGRSFVQQPFKSSYRTNSGTLEAHRAKSAYPLKSSSNTKTTATSARTSAARSSYGNIRLHSVSTVKTRDQFNTILNDTARLSLHKEIDARQSVKHVPQQTSLTGLKRMKLQPALIPKMETMYESALPPLVDVGRSPPKNRLPLKNQPSSQFYNNHKSSAAGGHSNNAKMPGEDDHFVIRKPTSAALHRNAPPSKSGFYYRHTYGTNGNRNDISDIRVGVVGTSFDPVVRPIRLVNKFRP